MRKVIGTSRLLLIVSIFVVVLLLGTQSTSHALSLWLYEGSVNASMVVADNSSQDSNPATGAITFNGFFRDWEVNITATSKPVIGSASSQTIVLNADLIALGYGLPLDLAVKDQGFTTPVNTLVLNASGTSFYGDLSAFYDQTNTETFSPIGTTFTPFITSSGDFSGTTQAHLLLPAIFLWAFWLISLVSLFKTQFSVPRWYPWRPSQYPIPCSFSAPAFWAWWDGGAFLSG